MEETFFNEASLKPPSEQLINLSINININTTTDSDDRISKLPDSLLHHILSFLPTKEAARSSVLSKHWQYLWTWLPILHLDLWGISSEDYATVESIALKILRSRRASVITKFSLSCRLEHKLNFISVHQILSDVVDHNVEELYFHVGNASLDPFKFDLGIFSCKTLVVLKLKGDFILRFDSSVELPSVKVLHLIYVKYEGEDTIQNLYSGCPVLDDLYIERGWSWWMPHMDTNYRVSLTSLVWEDSHDPCLELIYLDVPALKYLTLHLGEHPPVLVLKNTGKVERAEIRIRDLNMEMDWRRVMQMFKPLYGVLHLNLSINGNTPDKESEYHIPSFHDFPRFENLVELKLSSYCFTWRLILHMLHNCPRLQHLTFSKVGNLPFYSANEENICECCWMPPYQFCLDSQLTTFKFEGFQGTELELKLIQYVMKNSKVLRDVTIGLACIWMELEQQLQILQELSTFERASTTCQLNCSISKEAIFVRRVQIHS